MIREANNQPSDALPSLMVVAEVHFKELFVAFFCRCSKLEEKSISCLYECHSMPCALTDRIEDWSS